MKKSIFLLFALAMPVCAFSWSRVGHSTVAQIAYDHLTPKAKKAILEKTGGITLMAMASDGDAYRAVWTTDLGFIPSNLESIRPKDVSYLKGFDYTLPENIVPYPHCVTIKKDGTVYRDIRKGDKYIHNAAWYVNDLTAKLKSGSLDEEQTCRAIALITHFVGDMHCPVHIIYESEKLSKGAFKIEYKGKTMKYHSFWDKEMIGIYSATAMDAAAMSDICSESEIAELTKGDVFDWAEDSGRACYKTATEFIPSTKGEIPVVSKLYPRDNRALLFSQLRNAGYRLASLLNRIYGE